MGACLTACARPVPILPTPNATPSVIALTLIADLSQSPFTDVALSPDGTSLVVSNAHGLWLYDPKHFETPPRLITTPAPVVQLAFAAHLLAVLSETVGLSLAQWDANTLMLKQRWPVSITTEASHLLFNPTGKTLALADATQIFLLDTDTGTTRATLKTMSERLAFNAAGDLLAVADQQGQVSLWDAQTGQLQARWSTDFSRSINALTFNLTGQMLIVNAGNIVQVWENHAGEWQHGAHYQVYDYALTALHFDADGTHLLGVGQSLVSFEWRAGGLVTSASDLAVARVIPLPGFNQPLALNTTTQHWAVLGANYYAPPTAPNALLVFDAITGQNVFHLSSGVFDVAFNPIASGATEQLAIERGGVVELWSVAPKGIQPTRFLTASHAALAQLAFSPDGQTLVAAAMQAENFQVRGALHRWAVGTGQALPIWVSTEYDHGGAVADLDFASNGEWLLFGFSLNDASCLRYHSSLTLWEARTGERLPPPAGAPPLLVEAALSPDGRYLAASYIDSLCVLYNTTLKIWDAATHTELASFQYPLRTGLANLTFSPDSTLLFASVYSETAQLTQLYRWDLTALTTPVINEYPHYQFQALQFVPSGEAIIIGDETGNLAWLNPHTGQMQSTLTAHSARITQLALSPTGRWLATTAADGTLKLWQLP